MNKFTKGCLVTALVLLLIGTALFVAGAVSGGFQQAIIMARNGELNYSLIGNHMYWDDDSWHLWWENEDYSYDEEKMLDGDFTQEYNSSEIQYVYIELGGGEIDIREYDNDQIKIVGNDTEELNCFQKDDAIYVIGQDEAEEFLGKVIIYLPKDKTLREVDFQVGGGKVNISDLSTKNLVIDIGGGVVSGNRIISDSADIKIGAGESVIKDSEIQEATISVGMGSSYFSGTIAGNLSADNSMGSIILDLDGSKEDHNYTISCEAGNVELGNDRFSGLAYDKEIDNGADSDFDLNCSMGNIQIRF